LRGQPFSVFGNDFSTDDGTAVRDYIHVSDLALAHLRALEFITTKKSDLICNLGTGKGTSILELVHSLKGLDAGFTFDFAPRRDGDPDRLVAANQLSRDILGLNYESSKIDNIISSSIAWIKQNESRFL
jgi:UDP-glucose 4-epimerase